MRKILLIAALTALASGCGAPEGGFLRLEIDDPKALVSLNDEKPVMFSELEQPMDLTPMPYKVSVTWSETGDTTTEFANVEYGKTLRFAPKPPKMEPVEISTSIPGFITAGFQELGHSDRIQNPAVYVGPRRFEVKLDGFDYRWSTEVKVGLNSKIKLEPGTDSKTGSLYIKSESQGVEFAVRGTAERQFSNAGSIFIPKVQPGMLEITEKLNPKVRHFVEIEAGRVTSLNFITNFSKSVRRSHKLETFGKTTLFICWGSQTTEIDLTDVKEIDSYTLDKMTPFRPGTMGSVEVFKFISCQDSTGFGAQQIAGALPEKLTVSKTYGTMTKPDLSLADEQIWSSQSADGAWTTEQDMIYGPGGYRFALGGFEAGCWDLRSFTVLTAKIDFENEAFEIREAPLSKRNPMVIGSQQYKGIGDTKLSWVKAFAFYDNSHFPMPVLATSSWTTVLKRDVSSNKDSTLYTPAYRIDKPCFSASLYSNRHLVCRKGNNAFSDSFLIDAQTGTVFDGLVNPSVTSKGYVVCNMNDGANAGIVFRISGITLVPVWAGLFQ